MTVTKNTLIGDLLANDMNTAKFLFEMGMHCVGCPASINESLEEACAVHGLDSDTVLKSILDYLDSKKYSSKIRDARRVSLYVIKSPHRIL